MHRDRNSIVSSLNGDGVFDSYNSTERDKSKFFLSVSYSGPISITALIGVKT